MKRNLLIAVALAVAAGASVPTAPASDTGSIYQALERMKSKDHSVLFEAVKEGNAADELKAKGERTLFAPTDAAFLKLNSGDIKKIATDKDFVSKLLRGHIVEGRYTTKELGTKDKELLPTLQGGTIKIEKLADHFRVGGAKLVSADITCSNGVIHVIDAVLPVPKE